MFLEKPHIINAARYLRRLVPTATAQAQGAFPALKATTLLGSSISIGYCPSPITVCSRVCRVNIVAKYTLLCRINTLCQTSPWCLICLFCPGGSQPPKSAATSAPRPPARIINIPGAKYVHEQIFLLKSAATLSRIREAISPSKIKRSSV